jgi:hypothetical protein
MPAAAAPFRYLPAQVQFDLRVLKFFKIGEHGKLDIVAESFNVLNHTNVVALNSSMVQRVPAFPHSPHQTRQEFQGDGSSQFGL